MTRDERSEANRETMIARQRIDVYTLLRTYEKAHALGISLQELSMDVFQKLPEATTKEEFEVLILALTQLEQKIKEGKIE